MRLWKRSTTGKRVAASQCLWVNCGMEAIWVPLAFPPPLHWRAIERTKMILILNMQPDRFTFSIMWKTKLEERRGHKILPETLPSPSLLFRVIFNMFDFDCFCKSPKSLDDKMIPADVYCITFSDSSWRVLYNL